ncbi:MAG: type II toxin-antitoxin system VapC family toxin [Candidatus Aquicultorales bacterium]
MRVSSAAPSCIIDTSVWILALRRDADETVKARVSEVLALDQAATVPIIKLELLGGTKTTTEFERLKSRLDGLPLINQPGEWEFAERLAFNLRREGLTVPCTDVLIATAAILTDSVVLHVDRHFDQIASKTNLRVENLLKHRAR